MMRITGKRKSLQFPFYLRQDCSLYVVLFLKKTTSHSKLNMNGTPYATKKKIDQSETEDESLFLPCNLLQVASLQGRKL